MEEQTHAFDIYIITALYEEANAVIEEFSTRCSVAFLKAFRDSNRQEYRYATIQNRHGEPLSIFVTWLSRMGPIRTALDLVPLLQEIRPRFVAMTGICAGDRTHVKLGDLIIATDAYHPEEGKTTMGADSQPVHLPEPRMASATTQVLQYIQSFDQWREPVRELKRQVFTSPGEVTEEGASHIGVIASSLTVRADQPFAAWSTMFHRKTLGVDMEAAAFYLALRDFPLVHGLVVKGVSDYGDSSKNDVYHDYAARASAVYVLCFLREYVTEVSMPRRDVPPSEKQTASSGVWNVPYLRNPHFTGRDELLERLNQHLWREAHGDSTTTRRAALTQPQAIKGLGGIGKTQIAVEYTYRSREQGRYINTLWVNAASSETLITSFVALADLLPAFAAKGETNQSKLVAAIKRWLERCQEPWLLIFDNADDLTNIQEYFPQWGNGSILLTTRTDAVGSLATSVEVGTMSFVEGTHLLLRRAQRFEQASDEQINEAGNIVVALDHFPLALDQAGAYIEETKCRFGDYLSTYQDHRKTLLARRGAQTTNYPDSVATTWSLSFQKVEQKSPAAAELLRMLAYLSPDRIPEELIKDGATHWTLSLQQAAGDPYTFNQMLEDLLKFSLVRRLVEEQMLSIHRLVQAVQRDTMEPELQCQWARRVVLAVNEVFPRDSKNAATWPQCLRYLEQAQACDTLIQHYRLVLTEAADLLDRTSIYLCEHALYTIAEPLLQCALSIREQQLGKMHPDVAYSLNALASLYNWQNKFVEAESFYQQALHIREQQLGEMHPDVAYSLNGLANLYREQGKYEQAEPLLHRALRILEQQLGLDHSDVARPLNNLANIYDEQGKYEQAEPLYRRALHIFEQQLGPEDPMVAIPLNNLAALYGTQGKYEQAEPLYQRALHIWEQQLGSEHPHLANSLNGLAENYREQGKYEQAEPLYQRALHIWEQQLGSEHSLVAYPLYGLAENYREQRKFVQAEPLYQRALSIQEHTLGLHHPHTADTLHSFAVTRELQNNSQEAVSLYQRVLAIRELAYGPKHPKTIETRKCLRAVLIALGRAEEAARLDVAQPEPSETEREHEARQEE